MREQEQPSRAEGRGTGDLYSRAWPGRPSCAASREHALAVLPCQRLRAPSHRLASSLHTFSICYIGYVSM